MLYTLATETLLSTLRKSQDVRGALGPAEMEIKVKGYADDTAVYASDLESVESTIKIVELVGQASDAKINLQKTSMLLCGHLIGEWPNNTNRKFVTDKQKYWGYGWVTPTWTVTTGHQL